MPVTPIEFLQQLKQQLDSGMLPQRPSPLVESLIRQVVSQQEQINALAGVVRSLQEQIANDETAAIGPAL